jgi:hypothetical protein
VIALKSAQTVRGRYNSIKNNAKRREIEFNISFEFFENVVKSVCFYCGGLSTGLDRENNDLGYLETNIVGACCPFCNKLRNNLLTVEETLRIVKLLQEIRGTQDIWAGYLYNPGSKRRLYKKLGIKE